MAGILSQPLYILMNMGRGLPDGEMWVVESLMILPGKEEKMW